MKILFFIRSLELGGAERQMANLAIELGNRGHQIAVVAMYEGGVLKDPLEESGIQVFCLKKKRRWQIVLPLMRLRRIVQRAEPEIVNSYGPEVNVFALFLKLFDRKHRLVWGVRNAGLSRKMYGIFERVLYWFECRLSGIPQLIIANSEAGRMLAIRDGFAPEKLIVIQNGINTEVNHRDPKARKRKRIEWGATADTKVIGMIGRVDPQKDHRAFISAIARLPKQIKTQILVVCAGYRTEEQIVDLRAYVREEGLEELFAWIRHDANVMETLNGLDMLVSSSNAEGFSNVLAEGLAVGLPCVATDVGDSRLIVDNFGLIVPARSPAALSSAIVELLGDSRVFSESFAQTAREHIVRNFSIKALGEKTETALSAII